MTAAFFTSVADRGVLSAFVVAGIIAALFFGLYLRLLPRPIPGIPYNEEATKNVFGDMPALLAHLKKTKEAHDWLRLQTEKLQSPIVQVFATPFGKPWVIVADHREAYDILSRRTPRDFDRSTLIADLFAGALPGNHVHYPTNDVWKAHRNLIKDLMTPAFLETVAAPQIHRAVSQLVGLWQQKARLSEGHPFPAGMDIYHATLDGLWAFSFGAKNEDSASRIATRKLATFDSIKLPENIDEAAGVSECAIPEAYQAILDITSRVGIIARTPFPRLADWVIGKLPWQRKAYAIKDRTIGNALENARVQLESADGIDHSKHVTCALDHIVHRELQAAQKEDRPTNYHTRTVYDEILGFMVAGHDTTSTTFSWGVKFLSDQPMVQRKLRDALRHAFSEAVRLTRQPTIQEIMRSRIPYLDAVQEEIHRRGLTAPFNPRITVIDTIILGYCVPKGTDVILINNGPGFITPAMGVKEEVRSESSRKAAGRVGEWDPSDMGDFKPERWLKENKQGETQFNPTAGPSMSFGAGPRGCYGRRLAYLQLKCLITLIIWNFELDYAGDKFSNYDAEDRMTHQPQQCYLRLKTL